MNNYNRSSNADLGLAALLVLLAAASSARIAHSEMEINARVYSRLMGGNPKDNWIKSPGFLTESNMKDCRFSIFSKFIPEMNEDFAVLKSRTFVERIISSLSSREIDEFYRNASRITDLDKSGFSTWLTSDYGKTVRSLYMRARKNSGLV